MPLKILKKISVKKALYLPIGVFPQLELLLPLGSQIEPKPVDILWPELSFRPGLVVAKLAESMEVREGD